MAKRDDCGSQHIRLAGIIVIVVTVIIGGAFTLATRTMGDQEERLRAVEINRSATAQELKGIQATLKRIEQKWDQHILMESVTP